MPENHFGSILNSQKLEKLLKTVKVFAKYPTAEEPRNLKLEE
jgi:hypothetical protein